MMFPETVHFSGRVVHKKAKKTNTEYAYDPMENEIYQLTNDMVIVNHKNTGFN